MIKYFVIPIDKEMLEIDKTYCPSYGALISNYTAKYDYKKEICYIRSDISEENYKLLKERKNVVEIGKIEYDTINL